MVFFYLMFLILIMIFVFISKVFFELSINKFIVEKHKHLEYILETKNPPNIWLKNTKNVQKKCLKKLTNLIKYLQSSKLVDSEESRKKMLLKLNKIQKNWMKKEYFKQINIKDD
ncbi:hypothetical protein OSSY52_16430 [Tepiditoga spiralis]|uniref:Uncharacterized protein n=1 Tax=Tepiditoga spiralis TaxID=2108365 RepID=A0A7G1GB23_9BACT|nr:hypothetical protein [Tepiditoga spiralis]BBE31502.1 hypothetical protein OSSY52_16430 [Tepiditoga spiralis]